MITAVLPFKLGLLRATHLRAADVATDDEVSYTLFWVAPGNIAQHLVELFGLSSARFVHGDAPVFTENSEVELGVNRFVTDEGGLRRRGRELLEVSC